MKLFSVTLIPKLLATAGVCFSAQAGYALLRLDQHYSRVRGQVAGWCDKTPGCSGAELTGNLSDPEITVAFRGKIRDRASLGERVSKELEAKGLLILEPDDGVSARRVAIRVDQ